MPVNFDERLLLRGRKYQTGYNLSRWKDKIPRHYSKGRSNLDKKWILAGDVLQKLLGIHKHTRARDFGLDNIFHTFFNVEKCWKFKKKGMKKAEELNLIAKTKNYYYFLNKEVSQNLWNRVDITVKRGKFMAWRGKTDWNLGEQGIVLPSREDFKENKSEELEEARRQLEEEKSKYKAAAPISNAGGFAQMTLDDVLKNINPTKYARLLREKDAIGACELWEIWDDDDMPAGDNTTSRRRRRRRRGFDEQARRGMPHVYNIIKGLVKQLRMKRKFCGFLGTCVKHRKELCRICSEKGDKMTYKWICVEGESDSQYIFGAWQGYFSKLLDKNQDPIGPFELVKNKHCRFESPRDG